MSSKRSSFRHSWVRFASELCQRSFESSFVHLSPLSGYPSIPRPHPAHTRHSSVHYEECLVAQRSTESDSSSSLYSVDSILPQPSSIYSTEQLRSPQNSYSPEEHQLIIGPGAIDISSPDEKSLVFRTATRDDLGTFIAAHPLPTPRGHQTTRELRYGWFSAYRKLWVFAITANIAVMATMVPLTLNRPAAFSYKGSSTATGANLLVAALMRQEHVVNTLFRMACLLPNHAPLSFR